MQTKMLKTVFLILILLISPVSVVVFGETNDVVIERVEPPHWWVGMNNTELELLIYGKNIGELQPSINYDGVKIVDIVKPGNKNYQFVKLVINSEAEPGTFLISFKKEDKQVLSTEYALKQRVAGSALRKSFGPEDVFYLLMPDRFANGNPENDSVEEMIEKANRTNKDGRHGGDIQGIIDRLDYLNDLGITTIWSTPLLESNMEQYSYHGYATTDYYRIDPRYGTNRDYYKLSEELHKRNMKLVMDFVPNHCGLNHWWINDLPMEDWIHQYPEFTRTNYRISTVNDPYVSEYDYNLNVNGWFDVSMPDLNQENEHVLTYLKQMAIFWIEQANLDGLRVDTYPYNDKWKAAEWAQAILNEYPNINLVGECWQHRPAEIAYWQKDVHNYDSFNSYLPSVMDFPLTDAYMEAFNEDEASWDGGVTKIYNNLVMDYLYADP